MSIAARFLPLSGKRLFFCKRMGRVVAENTSTFITQSSSFGWIASLLEAF
ncbi:uncharacterized protein PHALS_08129 [Plasmopara halstedii]|uniref:Uncharacterized protein n=1 Tax=Plasmopara halstedii TaxID=4781 RepID=A0A0P1B8X7_PLAHL|nr:uncharacterized protein PHALS_08129 [Plasmopara halstedii]CEG50417.1 hypothetical protein PHALS_08129 [Plasmopara halstedii]|eukprot:XP_024586786.1 hypothetical protein PHALS_08129 [Plasmopara halstedii]